MRKNKYQIGTEKHLDELFVEHMRTIEEAGFIITNLGWSASDTEICSKCYRHYETDSSKEFYCIFTTTVDKQGYYYHSFEERS